MAKCPRPTFPNETLEPCWDVLQKIQRLLRWLPHGYTAEWIKGHQGSTTPEAYLTEDAKLNIRADKLAGEFQAQSMFHAIYPFPMIDGTKCKYRKTIRHIRPMEDLLQHIQKKNKWSYSTMDSIDWESHKSAVRSWPSVHKLSIPPSTTSQSRIISLFENQEGGNPLDFSATSEAGNAPSEGQHPRQSSESIASAIPNPSSCSSTFLPTFLHLWLPTGSFVSRYNEALLSPEYAA
jgi:hypothetical protein